MTLLVALLAALPAALAIAPAQAATPSPAALLRSADDAAAETLSDDPSEEDATVDSSTDEPADTPDACEATNAEDAAAPEGAEAADDPGGDAPSIVDIALGTFDDSSPDPGAGAPPADGGDSGDVPDSSDDASDLPDDCAPADPAGEAADGGTLTVTRNALLKGGVLKTGTVSVAGAGRVTQQLWLPAGKVRHGLRASVARQGHKPRRAAGTGGRLLGGTVTRTVTQAGILRLGVRLNQAARAQLRRAKASVTITVRTTTRPMGGKAVTKVGTVLVRR
jgi:hypothetical protein